MTPFWIDHYANYATTFLRETTVFYFTSIEKGAFKVIITFYDEEGNKIESMTNQLIYRKGINEMKVENLIQTSDETIRRTGYCIIISELPLYINGIIISSTYGRNIQKIDNIRTINFFPLDK
jgi:hypothetical protein